MRFPVAVDSREAPPPATLETSLLTSLRLRASPTAEVHHLTAGAASAEVCGPLATAEPLPTAYLLQVLSAAEIDRLTSWHHLSLLKCLRFSRDI